MKISPAGWKVEFSGAFFISSVFTFVLLFFSLFLYNSMDNYSGAFKAQSGRLALEQHDLHVNVSLVGEWEFYNDSFISSLSHPPVEANFVNVPHRTDEAGYGSYRLVISGLQKAQQYSLRLPYISPAYRLYIDRVIRFSSGHAAADAAAEAMELQNAVINFTPSAESVEILIETSDYSIYQGGFLQSIRLGLLNNVHAEEKRAIIGQMILLGGMLMIALYNLSLFLLNTSDKAALYFSLFSFMVVARLCIIGERIVNLWFDRIDWALMYKLMFSSGAVMLIALAMYMMSIYLVP